MTRHGVLGNTGSRQNRMRRARMHACQYYIFAIMHRQRWMRFSNEQCVKMADTKQLNFAMVEMSRTQASPHMQASRARDHASKGAVHGNLHVVLMLLTSCRSASLRPYK